MHREGLLFPVKNIINVILEIIDNPALKYLIYFIFLWYEIRSRPNHQPQ